MSHRAQGEGQEIYEFRVVGPSDLGHTPTARFTKEPTSITIRSAAGEV